VKIGIAVFSGTGNTAHVAGLLGKEFLALGATVDIHRIDSTSFHIMDAVTTGFDPSYYDLVGIGHPILGFGSPPLVLRFAEVLPPGRGRMFVFKSAADNHCVNNAASEDLIRILEHKGYEVFHDFLYVMPCNWVISYQRRFNLQIIDKAEEKAAYHAKAIDAQWMKWCIVKGGYRLKDYLGASDLDRTFITGQSRGYWRHFQEYFK
jgi:hypothetical protein